MTDGFILVGGRSTRMGQPKALLSFKGQTFLEIAVSVLKKAGLRVRIAAGAEGDFSSYTVPVVKDMIPDIGPLGGIYTALSTAESNRIVIHSCDCPLIPVSFFEQLVEGSTSIDIAVPIDNMGRVHPLSGAYSKDCLLIVSERIRQGKLSVKEFLKIPDLKVQFLDPTEHGLPDSVFLNINTGKDYQELLKVE